MANKILITHSKVRVSSPRQYKQTSLALACIFIKAREENENSKNKKYNHG